MSFTATCSRQSPIKVYMPFSPSASTETVKNHQCLLCFKLPGGGLGNCSLSDNHTSDKPHWPQYCHCAELGIDVSLESLLIQMKSPSPPSHLTPFSLCPWHWCFWRVLASCPLRCPIAFWDFLNVSSNILQTCSSLVFPAHWESDPKAQLHRFEDIS